MNTGHNLPEGWSERRVGDVLRLQNGYAFKPAQWSTTGLPIIRIQNLNSRQGATFNCFSGEIPDKFRARSGDLLFAWSGTPGTSFGAHVWSGGDAWINQHIFRVDFSQADYDRDFLRLALNANLTAYIAAAQGGVGLAHITKAKLNESLLVTPPLEVQRRIAALERALAEKTSSTVERAQVARRAMARFRQTVLAAACSGRLSADWRDARGRQALSGAALPGWSKSTIGAVAESIRGGSTEPPAIDVSDFPVLRSSSVRPFQIDYTDVRFLRADQSNREVNFLADGDLLITRLSGSIEYVGNAAVVRGLGQRRIQYPDRLFRCRLIDPAEADFLELAFAGPQLRAQIEGASRSAAGHQRVSISDIKAFTFQRPPIDEQREIVRRAGALLRLADELGDRIGAAARRVEHAGQAALAKAFRGEPVS